MKINMDRNILVDRNIPIAEESIGSVYRICYTRAIGFSPFYHYNLVRTGSFVFSNDALCPNGQTLCISL